MRIFICVLLAAALATAADWPRFRGPNGAGFAAGAAPSDLSKPAWKVPVPAGKSSPILIGNTLLLTAHEGDALLTLAYDSKTGKQLWRRELKKHSQMKRHKLNDPAAPTPAADPERVVVFFPEFGLAAYTLDGKPLWTYPLPPMASMQGVSASPLLHGGNIYLVVDQALGSYALSLNAATGKLRWRQPRPDAPGGIYSTPVLFKGALAVLGDIEFSAYSLATGERIWWVSGLPSQAKTSPAVCDGRIVLSVNAMAEESQIPVFAAVLAADGNKNNALDLDEAKGVPRAVFPTVDRNRDNKIDEAEWTAFREQALQPSSTIAIQPSGAGDITASAVKWRSPRAVPNVPSPLIAGGHVYTIRNGGLAGIYSLATGDVIKEFRLPGALGDYYASPVASNKHVYFASMEGKVTVLEQGPAGTIAATFPFDEEIFATPALSANALYLRTQQSLYCFRITN